MLTLVLAASLSSATDVAEAPAPAVDIQAEALRRAGKRAGWGWGGFGMTVGGTVAMGAVLQGKPLANPVYGVGVVALLAGPPLMLGMSWSSQRLLGRAGARASAVPALVGLGMLGLGWYGLVMERVEMFYVGFICSTLLGGTQLVLDHVAEREAELYLMPAPVEGGAGLSLVVRL